MKLLQLAAVLGGAASAVSAIADPVGLPRREDAFALADAITTTTFLTTSVFTVTKCGTDVTDCPTDGTAIITSVVAVTTTICPVTSSAASVPIEISGIPVNSWPNHPSFAVTSATPASSAHTASVLPPSPSSGVVTIQTSAPVVSPPSSASSAGPSSGGLTIQTSTVIASLSSSPPSQSSVGPSSVDTTFTDAVPTSKSSPQPSSVYTPPSVPSSGSLGSTFTDAVPTSKPTQSSSAYDFPSAPSSGSPGVTTNTEAVPTSKGSSSSSYAAPSNPFSLPPSIGITTATEAVPTSKATASSSYGTPSGPVSAPSSNGATTAASLTGRPSGRPSAPPSSNGTPSVSGPGSSSTLSNTATEPVPTFSAASSSGSTDVDITTRVTSIRTQTVTSLITATVPGSSSSRVDTPGFSTVVPITSLITASVPNTPGWSTIVPIVPTISPVYPIPSNHTGTVGPDTTIQPFPSSSRAVLPSGSSGYPHPSNGTWPSPTVSMVPINGASKVGKASTIAIVIAFAFAVDNQWLPFMLCLNTVAAQDSDDTETAEKFVTTEVIVLATFATLILLNYGRYIATRHFLPKDPEKTAVVQEFVRDYTSTQDELDYYTALHGKAVNRRASAVVGQ